MRFTLGKKSESIFTMFESAAKRHFVWNCNVGGGSKGNLGKSHGSGCVLDARHTLSAWHCWRDIRDRYDWPVVLRPDGLFKAEVVYHSAAADIVIFRSLDKLPTNVELPERLSQYPSLSDDPLFLGVQVGFISRLTIHNSIDDSTSHSHFGAGYTSMFAPSEEDSSPRIAISSVLMQKGFSGSAVFKPDGSIVGVLVQTLSFRADFKNLDAPIYSLPLISPIGPLIHEIHPILSEG